MRKPGTSGKAMQRSRLLEQEYLVRIRANPAIDECPNCTLLKPIAKPVCECCQAEARGEYLSDHQETERAA